MKKIVFPLITLFYLSLANLFSAQPVWEEDFSNAMPSTWKEYSGLNMDYAYVSEGLLNMLKMENEENKLTIAIDKMNFSDYTKFEFDVQVQLNLKQKCKLIVGVIRDEEKPYETFELIDVFNLDKDEDKAFSTKSVYLKEIQGEGRLALTIQGDFIHILKLDNFKLYNSDFETTIPKNIEEFNFISNPNGDTNGEFSWKNPSQNVNGEELSELTKIELYSNDILIKTIENPTIGQDLSFTQDFEEAGKYEILISPFNSEGKGLTRYSEIWVGMGVPDVVENLTIENNEGNVTLNWTPPTKALNDAFFDGVISEYKIIRSDDSIFTISGDETTFKNELPHSGVWRYEIIAVNGPGEGAVESTGIINNLYNNDLHYDQFDFDVRKESYEKEYEFLWTTSSTSEDTEFKWQNSTRTKGKAGEFFLSTVNEDKSSEEVIRLISRKFDTDELTTISLISKILIQARDKNKPVSLTLETTKDDGATWNEVYTWEVRETFNKVVKKIISTSDLGSDNFQFAFTFKGNPYDILGIGIDNLRAYTEETTDIVLSDIIIPNEIEPGENFNPVILIENLSTQNEEFDLEVKIENRNTNEEVYSNLQTLTMSPGENKTLEVNDFIALEGEFTISVNINSDRDINANNDSKTLIFNNYYLLERNLVLCEKFTGTWCVACPGAALGLEELMHDNKPIAVIAYHTNDNYQTNNAAYRNNYYNVTGVPTVVFNGLEKFVGGSASESIAEKYIPYIEDNIAKKSALNLEVEADYENGTLAAKVTIQSLSPINQPLRFFAAVTESEIPENWKGLSKLDFVERKLYPNSNGKVIDLKDKEEVVEFEISNLGDYDEKHMEFIVFVQNTSTKEVFNAQSAKFEEFVGIEDNKLDDSDISVFPNPSSKFINITNAEAADCRIISIQGQEIYFAKVDKHHFRVDLQSFASGTYYLTLEKDNKVFRKVISINK